MWRLPAVQMRRSAFRFPLPASRFPLPASEADSCPNLLIQGRSVSQSLPLLHRSEIGLHKRVRESGSTSRTELRSPPESPSTLHSSAPRYPPSRHHTDKRAPSPGALVRADLTTAPVPATSTPLVRSHWALGSAQ